MFRRLMLIGLIIFAFTLSASGKTHISSSKRSDVKKAQEVISVWLNSFEGKNRTQVEKILGTISEKDTWNFKGKNELLLRYKPEKRGALLLYFFKERVIKSSLQLLSD